MIKVKATLLEIGSYQAGESVTPGHGAMIYYYSMTAANRTIGTVQSTAGVTREAQSMEGAEEIALATARELWPPDRGWSDHQVAVGQLPHEWVLGEAAR